MIILKSDEEIEIMRAVGRIVAECHAMLASIIKPGITTMEIDRLVEEKIRSRGAEKLMKACHQSLFLGIEQAVVGNRIGDIGYAIDSLAQHYEYGNVREFTGHAVEPMLTLGSWRYVFSRLLNKGKVLYLCLKTA